MNKCQLCHSEVVGLYYITLMSVYLDPTYVNNQSHHCPVSACAECAGKLRSKYEEFPEFGMVTKWRPGSEVLTQQQENTQPPPVQPSESTPKKPGTK